MQNHFGQRKPTHFQNQLNIFADFVFLNIFYEDVKESNLLTFRKIRRQKLCFFMILELVPLGKIIKDIRIRTLILTLLILKS